MAVDKKVHRFRIARVKVGGVNRRTKKGRKRNRREEFQIKNGVAGNAQH